MPNTSLQISNGIETFKTIRKDWFEKVQNKCSCPLLENDNYNILSINYLEAYMPHKSLQISNGIWAFDDKKKAKFDSVHHRWLCT